MTVDADAEGAQDSQELPPEDAEGQEPSGQEEPSPPPQPSARERELERRLTQQGRELSQTRQALTAITPKISTLESAITSLTHNLSARDQADADRREQEREAYLKTLPADQRALKKVELLEAELKSLRSSRTDAQPARSATPPVSNDPDVAYMRQVAQGIVERAQRRYGVALTPEEIRGLPEAAWEDEHAFHDHVYDLASEKASRAKRAGEGEEDDVPKGKDGKDEADERTRRIVRQELGTGSPTAPRAAAPKGKRPGEDDVKQVVNTYNSAEGPRGNIKRLKELRARMG